jgi:hypothetical protein
MLDQAAIVKELDTALEEYAGVVQGAKYRDLSDKPAADLSRVLVRLIAAAERFAPPGSVYLTRVRDESISPQALSGAVRALRDDIAANRTKSLTELVHAEVFGDFLDMAQHLLDQGFKDAAAVIAGSSLEAHLRALCLRNGIPTDDASGRPKKADMLNAELHTANAYLSKGDLKNVVAWLDLRNDAAHGHYAKYAAPQVNLLIASIRDFFSRYPA